MRLGVSSGIRSADEVTYKQAFCCLCRVKFVGKLADDRLKEHLNCDHSRVLMSIDSKQWSKGLVTTTYSGPKWTDDMGV